MLLAAFTLVFCAQEPQRSRERDEPARTGVQVKPAAEAGARVRNERERERDEAGRGRRDLRDGGLRPGSGQPARASPRDLGLGLGLAPELEGPFSPGSNPGSPGSQPAQFYFDLGHSTPDGGLGIYATHSRSSWPALPGLEPSEAGEIAEGFDDRVGIDGWLALGSSLELYGRAEQWFDETDSGGTLRARATWHDAFGPGGPFELETYVGSGRSVHAAGVRASGHKRLGFGGIGLSWDATDLDDEGVDEKLLQHAVRADIDFALGKHWSLGVYARSQFGDAEDSVSFGFALQIGID